MGLRSRVVIASHVKYQKALELLIESLKKANFETSNIVVVVAASDDDKVFQTKDWIQINYSANNFEYSSYEAIAANFKNTILEAEQYIFIHDTCWVGSNFKNKIEELPLFEKIHLFGGFGNSNINAVPKKYLPAIKGKYKRITTKKEAVKIEVAKIPPAIRGSFFVSVGPDRILKKEEDVYSTGHTRKIYHYEELDLYKAINWCHDGDILGKQSYLFEGEEKNLQRKEQLRVFKEKYPLIAFFYELPSYLHGLSTKVLNQVSAKLHSLFA